VGWPAVRPRLRPAATQQILTARRAEGDSWYETRFVGKTQQREIAYEAIPWSYLSRVRLVVGDNIAGRFAELDRTTFDQLSQANRLWVTTLTCVEPAIRQRRGLDFCNVAISGSFRHFMNQLRRCRRWRAVATHLVS